MVTEIHSSKLARPMSCAGSLFFKDLLEDPPGDAAKEGTAAGEYLEHLIKGESIPTHAKNGVPFDDDMKHYATAVYEQVDAMRTAAMFAEERVDWQTRSGIWIKGKYDICFMKDGVLYVDDYKYGWNIVEPEMNWQLISYAIGEVMRRKGITITNIVLRIHQPRPHHEAGPTREWRITMQTLLDLKDQIEDRMIKISEGFNHLQTGSHCKYCPAAAEACPAFNKSFYRGVEVANEFLQDHISDDEVSFQLDLLATVSERIKIKASSLEALAVNRIKEGKLIPNYLTEERLGDRAWKSGISPDVIKLLTGKDIVEQVMLSPAKAEKIGVPKQIIASMVDRKFLGQKLKRVATGKMGDKIFGKGDPNEKMQKI